VFKVRVVTGEVQTGMTNLIFHEVTGHRIHLDVANSTMPESVHSTGFYAEFFADWRQHPSANVPVFQWRANA